MSPKKFYNINQYIKADRLRVVDEEGEQVDVLPKEEALELAKEKGLDLVEVAPKAKPPVAKIIDFKKFQYLQNKKKKKAKKLSKKHETKELRVRPFIGENDLQFRIKKAKNYLKEGHQVRLVVQFRGREMTNQEAGHELIEKFAEAIKPFGKKSKEPKMVGHRLMVTFISND